MYPDLRETIEVVIEQEEKPFEPVEMVIDVQEQPRGPAEILPEAVPEESLKRPSFTKPELTERKPEAETFYPEEVDATVLTEAPESLTPDTIKPEEATPVEVPIEEIVSEIIQPVILKDLNDVEAPVGSEARLECQIIAQPKPKVEWLRAGKPVQGERFISVSELDGTNVLVITPVEEEDDAEFECRVTTTEGTVSSFADVYVSEKVSERTEVVIDKVPLPLQPIELIVDVGEAPQEETVTEVTQTVTETVTTTVEEVEEQPESQEITEIVIQKDQPVFEEREVIIEYEEEREPQVEEIVMPVEILPEEELPEELAEYEVVLPEDVPDEEDEESFEEISERTSVTIEKKPQPLQPVELLIEVEEMPQEKVTEVVETVTETVTTVVEEEDVPDLRETIEVVIEQEEKPFEPVEMVIDVQEQPRGPAEILPEAVPEESLKRPSFTKPELTERKPEAETFYPEEVDATVLTEAPESLTPDTIKPEEATPVEVPIEEIVSEIIQPVILKDLNDVEAPVGSEARLECQIIAQPKPKVEWLRAGKPVQGERFISVSELDGTNVLVITPVEEEDDAEFECRVTTTEGTVSSFADVYVSEKVSERTEVVIDKVPLPFQPVELIVDVGEAPQEETVTEVTQTVTETVTTTVEEVEEQSQIPETTEIVIQKKILPEEESEDEESEVSERTEITIERKPAPHEVQLVLAVEEKPETVTETVTTVIEKKETPETRETTVVTIERERTPLQPVELVLDVSQQPRGPAEAPVEEFEVVRPEYEELVIDEEEVPVEEFADILTETTEVTEAVTTVVEDVSETREVTEVVIDRKPEDTPEYIAQITIEKEDVPDTREITEVVIEKKPEEYQPFEIVIETSQKPSEETVTEVTETVTETVTTVVEEQDVPTTREVTEVIIDRKPEETPEYIAEISIEKEDVPDTREITEVVIEKKPEEYQPFEIVIETSQKPSEETVTEVTETVTETVTTVVEEQDVPTTREVTEVIIDRKPEETPEYIAEISIEKEDVPDTREITEVTIERKEETLQPIELVIDVAEEQIEEKVTIEIIRNLTDIETKIGEEVRFVCNIIGYPRPSITWLINRQPVRSDRFITMYELDGTCTLIIKEVIEEDETVYECVAENQAGFVSTQAELIIFSKGKVFK